jgi:hypothetical protein
MVIMVPCIVWAAVIYRHMPLDCTSIAGKTARDHPRKRTANGVAPWDVARINQKKEEKKTKNPQED